MLNSPELVCGFRLRKFSLLYDYYAYIDVSEYLADSLFIKNKVRVYYHGEYAKQDSKYLILLCKCRKKDSPAFCAALQELTNKMLICGHTDFVEYCKKTKDLLIGGIQRMREGACISNESGSAEKTKQKSSESVS